MRRYPYNTTLIRTITKTSQVQSFGREIFPGIIYRIVVSDVLAVRVMRVISFRLCEDPGANLHSSNSTPIMLTFKDVTTDNCRDSSSILINTDAGC